MKPATIASPCLAATDPLRLLSVRELASVFGVGEDAIRKRIRLRQLGPVIRRGKGYAMRAESLRRFLEDAESEWMQAGRETPNRSAWRLRPGGSAR